MIMLTREPIDPAGLISGLGREGSGSLVVHFGVVKPDPGGRKSRGITFSDKGGLEAELKGIESDLRDKFNLLEVVLVRRLGTLAVGDFILAALVSAKDRENAFSACREAVERFKKMKAINKEEHYVE